jgi:hypothetical protein
MPREMLSTNAPLSAAGSAAQPAITEEEETSALIRPADADRASWRVRPKLRMVAGGAPVIEADVESYPYQSQARVSAGGGEVLVKDWAEDWPEDPLDSIEARPEARLDDGGSRAPFLALVENGDGDSKAQSTSMKSGGKRRRAKLTGDLTNAGGESRRQGLKKLNDKQISMDKPPTPRGCEWRRSDEGLNLWRCWTDWDDDKTKKIKKSRYAGHLSDDAWRIMKEYDHEAFISIVGERLRRHSGR